MENMSVRIAVINTGHIWPGLRFWATSRRVTSHFHWSLFDEIRVVLQHM